MELETYLLEEYPEKCNNDIACKKCDTWVFKASMLFVFKTSMLTELAGSTMPERQMQDAIP